MTAVATGAGAQPQSGKVRLARALVAGMLALVHGTAAIAQSTTTQAGGWQYEFTPYLWAAGMKGDTQTGTLPKVSVDAGFDDILDVLDFGVMGAFEARKGRWGMLFDAVYMKLSDAATASRTGPGPIGATLTANANVEMKQTVLAGAAAYRAVEGGSPVDLIGGLRYNRIEVNADINASLFALTGTVARSGKEDWFDPYVGVRIQHPVGDRWKLVGYADIGGFGVGSDVTWQVMAGASYDFSKTVAGKFGYRAYYADYDKNGFLYDIRNEGLYVGIGIRF